MSLLNRGTEVVTVFPEAVRTDSDGNTVTAPGTVGVVTRAVVQPMSSTENNEGTESKYRLRLIGWQADPLGAQSAVEWRGSRYAIEGDPKVYTGSPRTARVEYVMARK